MAKSSSKTSKPRTASGNGTAAPKGAGPRPRARTARSKSTANGHTIQLSPGGVIEFIKANGGRSSAHGDHPATPTSRRIERPRRARAASAPRFIDLFCGIGGFRLAFERAGGRCVFSSDWDRFSRQTYAANFGEEPAGDINEVAVEDIPPFDILCGGFPCQPFSLAGVSKKNSLGRKHGFDCERQGNLFFSIAQVRSHQPRKISSL